MLTRVVIQEDVRQFRFVTTKPVGSTLRTLVPLVQHVLDTAYFASNTDLTFRIAEGAFTFFDLYPVEVGREIDVDWFIYVDCIERCFYVGRTHVRDRNGRLKWGESPDQIEWELQ